MSNQTPSGIYCDCRALVTGKPLSLISSLYIPCPQRQSSAVEVAGFRLLKYMSEHLMHLRRTGPVGAIDLLVHQGIQTLAVIAGKW